MYDKFEIERVYTTLVKTEEELLIEEEFKNYFYFENQSGEISLTLLNGAENFTKFSLSGSVFSLLFDSKSLTIDSSFGNCRCLDMSDPDIEYREIIGLKNTDEGSMIKISYRLDYNDKLIKKDESKKFDYKNFLYLQMNSIKFNYITQYFIKFQEYLKSSIIEIILLKNKRKRKFENVNITEKIDENIMILLNIEVELNHPIIILPKNIKSNDYMSANLGNIKIKNKLIQINERMVEKYEVSLTEMYLLSNIENEMKKSIEGININVEITRNLYFLEKLNKEEMILIEIFFSEIDFKFTHEQYQLVFDFINGNIRKGLENIENDNEYYSSLLEEAKEGIETIQNSLRIHEHTDIEELIEKEILFQINENKIEMEKNNFENKNNIDNLNKNEIKIIKINDGFFFLIYIKKK
jgi:vacuolar protein sorting-associated protein 13A/C